MVLFFIFTIPPPHPVSTVHPCLDEISIPSLSYADSRRSVQLKSSVEEIPPKVEAGGEDLISFGSGDEASVSPVTSSTDLRITAQTDWANDGSRLSPAAFRAVILAVPFLEQFFDAGFSSSFHLTKAGEKEILAEKDIQHETEIVDREMGEGGGLRKVMGGLVNSGKKARLSANKL